MRNAVRAKYVPPNLSSRIVGTITVVFALLSLSRGLNWSLDGEDGSFSDALKDTAFGLVTWGILLTISIVLLLSAMAVRKHFYVWCGHALTLAVYFGIALAVTEGIIDQQSGYESAIGPVGGTFWHAVLAYRMKPFVKKSPQEGL